MSKLDISSYRLQLRWKWQLGQCPVPQDVLRNGKGRKHCVDIGPVHLARKRHVTKGLAYQLLEFPHCLWLINSYISYIGYVFFGLPMGICPCSDPKVTPHVVGHLVSAAPHYSLIFLGQPLKLWHCGAGDVYFSRKLLHFKHCFLSLYSALLCSTLLCSCSIY